MVLCVTINKQEKGFQRELGENGTPHLQGCTELLKLWRWKEFGKKYIYVYLNIVANRKQENLYRW